MSKKKEITEIKFCDYNLFFNGEMAEWFKAADCKSVEVFHRRFESCSLQYKEIGA